MTRQLCSLPARWALLVTMPSSPSTPRVPPFPDFYFPSPSSTDSFKGLKVRSTPLSEIRAGRPHVWRPLFTSEAMYWPGFVEFDDYSSLAVTCCANTRSASGLGQQCA